MTREATQHTLGEQAWQLGQEYARQHPFAEHAEDRDSERLYQAAVAGGCWPSFFDVWKYGAQAIWRERGELPEPEPRQPWMAYGAMTGRYR